MSSSQKRRACQYASPEAHLYSVRYHRFLLARLYLDALSDRISPADVRDSLKNISEGSNTGEDAYKAAYAIAKQRIEDQKPGYRELAQKTIAWVALARTRLSMLQLRHALATTAGETDFNGSRMTSRALISSVCVGLLVIDQDPSTVRFVHETTQVYFESIFGEWFDCGHTLISRACFAYLSYDIFKKACADDEEIKDRLLQYPLLRYACLHARYHAGKTRSKDWEDETLRLVDDPETRRCIGQLVQTRCGTSDMGSKPRESAMRGLHIAAHFNLERTLETLLKRGEPPDSRDNEGKTPLWRVAASGCLGIVKILVDREDAKVDSKDLRGDTPFAIAAANDRIDVIRFLGDIRDVDVNSRANDGQTPFYNAVTFENLEVARILANRSDVDVELEGRDGLSIFAKEFKTAIMFGGESLDRVKLLLELDSVYKFPKVFGDDRQSTLSFACDQGNVELVKLLIDLEVTERYGRMPNVGHPYLTQPDAEMPRSSKCFLTETSPWSIGQI